VAWARIDDAFDDHPKVLALLEHDDGAAAIGLWTLCLAWANRNTRRKGKTPGRLPASLPRRYLGPPGKQVAELLTKVGLWDAVEDGWQIHDFDEYLPTEQTKAARSEAGKRGAAKRWADKPAGSDGKVPSTDSNLPSGSHDVASDDLANDGKAVANDGSRALARRATPYGVAPTPTPEPIPPSAGSAPPSPPADRPLGAGDVVAAYMDGAKAGGQPSPTEGLRGRVGKLAGSLIKQQTDPQRLLTAAFNCGAAGWTDLETQLQRDAAAAKPRAAPNGQPSSGPAALPERGTYDANNVFKSRKRSA
jgi:hypothetical protein